MKKLPGQSVSMVREEARKVRFAVRGKEPDPRRRHRLVVKLRKSVVLRKSLNPALNKQKRVIWAVSVQLYPGQPQMISVPKPGKWERTRCK